MIDRNKANNYIESKLGKPFAWGTNDCNTFIVGYFDAVLGTDLLKIIYKKYTTKLGAIRFQKKLKLLLLVVMEQLVFLLHKF